jgi:hypothetical protein
VLGRGAITYGEEDRPFYPWLTERVAVPLEVEADPGGLHGVVCRHLREKKGTIEDVCVEIDDILARECPEPGAILQSLASLSQCRTFFTLGFDPLMERALNAVRGGGLPVTRPWAFSYDRTAEDLATGEGTTLGYLFGRVSANPGFHLWDADAIELVWQLQRQLPALNELGKTLVENNLLIIGADLSDWMVRFLLRAVRQRPLTEGSGRNFLLADGGVPGRDDAIIFYDSLNRGIEVLPADPVGFARELCERALKASPAVEPSALATSAPLMEPKIPDHAIFVSYTRADAPAAFRAVAKLRDRGCLVWMDLLNVVGGDRFGSDLGDNVLRRCGFFLSLISRTTEGRREGWFHQERKWAAERARLMHDDEPFYFPAVIDDTPVPPRNEPPSFAGLHVSPSAGGDLPDDLVERLYQLQQRLLAGAQP